MHDKVKQIYAFEKKEEYEKYQVIIQDFTKKMKEYQVILEREYALVDPPKGVVWTSEELATSVFSEIPIPAYTNKDLIYMTPDIEAWQDIFKKQLDGKVLPHVQKFYEHHTEKEMLIILAHELTHHSDLFLDDFDEERNDGIWFEEGMCFYLPRKILLNEKEFNEVTNVETELVETFKDQYGNHSLEEFGSSSYQGSLSEIMFDYWRSYLTVKFLVEEWAEHDVQSVFDAYHQWDRMGRRETLTAYFGVEDLFK
jgi:hypothetical protein